MCHANLLEQFPIYVMNFPVLSLYNTFIVQEILILVYRFNQSLLILQNLQIEYLPFSGKWY